ncbi:TonB-linked outer membrane protein, SusC/RagA family [Chitinophaga arvensicola]|uniref:TonB-linked outer membrane protein, SusC/RagA family n=2 Tax=Chitinophaga arvensicola TaxID=29529 RepID=A0A1I0SAE5_9BACT|nr:TonB-linked outer membrane protein, SusC/RagA family [Chitinophaga arvensicola]
MKFAAIIICTACLQVSATGYGQEITLSKKNMSLEKIFRAIEKQTGYVFFFDHQQLDIAPPVNIDVKMAPLNVVMESCLKDLPLTYTLVGKNIVISFRPTPTTVTAGFLEITGKVSGNDGSPLPGATVVVKNTTVGALTKADGTFQINAAPGATLVVSYLGYETKEVTATAGSPLNIVLKIAVNKSSEVVVIGYGIAKKSDLTGAVSQIRSEDISVQPLNNAMQALAGRAPGVQVMQNNGAPGGKLSVRIRGVNSILGSNEPLYVIDGFPFTGSPDFLQPSDIASMEILKDASSTAIYGSRGANGIVMITTKAGKKKEGTTVDFSTGYSIQSVTKKMRLMSPAQYATLYNEQAKNDNVAPYFTQQQIDSFGLMKGTDWQDLVMRNAALSNTAVTVSGGNEKTRFSVGAGAYLQDGIVRNSNYKRYSIRASIEHDISRIFSLSYNATLTKIDTRVQNSSLGNRGSDLISAMLMAPPTLSPYLPDGSYRRLNTAYPFISNAIINPLVPINEVSERLKANRVFSNAAVTIRPFEDLTIRISGGINNQDDRRDIYANIEPSTNSVGRAQVNTAQTQSLLNENVVNYSKKFGRHAINATAGFTYQDNIVTVMQGSGIGFLSDNVNTGSLGSAATPGVPSSSYEKWVLLSFIGRLNYTLQDKYLFTVSMRRDGSSRYSKDNKWGNFPSAAIAWRASEEPFLKGSRVINDLKIRTSYGATGSTGITPYQTLNLLTPGTTIFGDAAYTGYAPGTALPNTLKWETTYQADFGFDVALFRDRVRFTADFYQKRTKNLLNNVQLPASMGYRTTVQNVGEMQNRGMEYAVDVKVMDKAVNWNVGANISFNRNKVIKLYNGQDIYGATLYTGSLNDYVNLLREGQPFGIFYGYVEKGYSSTGNLEYEDLNKDGKISAADKTYIGNPNPDFTYGINSVTSYKGFELSLFIQGSQGNDIFNLNKAATLDLGMGLNLPAAVAEDHWTPEHTNAAYPKITRNLAANMSSRFVENGSYLKIKNIQLAYNLPVEKLHQKWFRKAQVYVSAQNMITFTKYSWYDPEINAYGSENSVSQGIDYATYPISKSFTVGIRCGF